MSVISQLDVVNACLGSMGEAPLEAIDQDHDLTASALRVFKTQRIQALSTGWWFNRERVFLRPDPNTGFIYVPNDCIGIDASTRKPEVTIRGRRLYKTNTNIGQDPYKFDKGPIEFHYIRDVPFDDLPATAALWVQARTVRVFQGQYDADQVKMGQLQREEQEAYAFMNYEETRNSQVNLLDSNMTLANIRRHMYPR